MNTRYALVILVAAGMAGMPAAAGAQTAPDRIRTIVRTHAAEITTAVEHAMKVKGAYQRGEDRRQQSERISKTLSLGPNGELDISNLSGDVTVTRASGDQATVEAVKVGRGRTDEEALEMLRHVQVQITEHGRRAEVRTVYDSPRAFGRNRGFNTSVTYTIAAPAGTRLTVKTMAGNVTVSDIAGELSLAAASGDVRVTNARRITTAKTASGNVEITGTQQEGALEAATVSGNVILRKSRAQRIELGTVSGDVVITDVECERAEAHSLSGDVVFDGPLARNGRYEFNSHSGSVRLTIGGNVGYQVEANTFNGSLNVPPSLKQQGGGVEPVSRGRRVRSISGIEGDGSALLEITTFSGNVTITKR